MPQQCLPGTNIQMDLQGGQDYRQAFDTAFAIMGGIYLSQLADMVGVPGATLQNWVKRGFVASPVNKRYTCRQTCRIILIALLRHTLPLDDVVILLSSINNDLADEQDDLIDDSRLYLYFCDVVLTAPPGGVFDLADLLQRITRVTGDFPAAVPADLERLNRVLLVMVLAYESWQLRRTAEEKLAEIKKEEESP